MATLGPGDGDTTMSVSPGGKETVHSLHTPEAEAVECEGHWGGGQTLHAGGYCFPVIGLA